MFISTVGLTDFLTANNMKTKKTPPHFCKFTKTSKLLDEFYPPLSKFSRIRRKFRELLLISEENGRKCYTPLGNSGYVFEKERQLTRYFHMIHPYSKFREYWEIVAVVEMCFGLFLRLFLASHKRKSHLASFYYQIPALFADLFETADMLMRFFVGYVDKETQEIELEKWKVVTHCVSDVLFYPSFVVSLPFEFLIYLKTTKSEYSSNFFINCIFVKIFKLLTVSRYLKHMSKIHNWSDLKTICIKGFILVFLFCHWCACFFHTFLYEPEKNQYVDKIDDCFYHHFQIFYVVSSIFFNKNGYLAQMDNQAILSDVFWFISVFVINFFNAIMVCLIVQLMAMTQTSTLLYFEMKQEVQKFLAQENLPKHVHTKVMAYLQFRYRGNYFNEKIILETLSPPLKRKVLDFYCLNLLIHSKSIFYGLPNKMASDLCLLMTPEFFLPGDIIVKAGEKAKKIFFLYSGSVVVYSQKGKEIMHWYEGQQFGASSFIRNALHPVTVIALEMSETYVLRYSDFLKVAAETPNYVEMVAKAASERRKFVMALYSED